MDSSRRKHDLEARAGLLIIDILHIVARLVLLVCSLYLPEELRDVRIVTEAYEGLCIVTRDTDIVTFILPSELTVMLSVVS